MSRIQSLLQMLEQEPNDSFLRYALALEYKKTHPDKTLELLESLCFQEPVYLPAFYQLSQLYFENGEIHKAMSTAQSALVQAETQKDEHLFKELKELTKMIELAE
jgi:tetratricopeptide (TPR) repeat protein